MKREREALTNGRYHSEGIEESAGKSPLISLHAVVAVLYGRHNRLLVSLEDDPHLCLPELLREYIFLHAISTSSESRERERERERERHRVINNTYRGRLYTHKYISED